MVVVFRSFGCRLFSEWSDFFTGESPTAETPTALFERSGSESFYVKDAFLQGLTSRAISVSGSASATKLFVESSSFDNCCESSGDGGAIYFYTGGWALEKVCGSGCTAKDSYTHGNFAYLCASSIASCANAASLCSV
jgi:hypothetical protein